MAPTKTAQQVWTSGPGEDFWQLVSNTGDLYSWIDYQGFARGNLAASVGAGVSSINALTGSITLAAGTGATLTTVGNTITIAAPLAGVSSLNGETGGITLVAGNNTIITPAGNNITISSVGSSVVANVSTTGATSSIPTTTLFPVPAGQAGMYRVNVDLICTTTGAAGYVNCTIGWNNGTSSPAMVTQDLDLTKQIETFAQVGNFMSAQSQNITYFTTVSGGAGAVYSLNIRLEFLGTIGTPSGVIYFADEETPTGATPGTAFTLANSPSPAASLILTWNGFTLTAGGIDYTLVGNALTMVKTVNTGDSFVCWYRY